jgi:hypothetical protein
MPRPATRPAYLKDPGEGKVLPRWKTAQGWTVLQIHGPSAVPGYDLAAVSEGMSPDMIEREIHLNWATSGDKRVYPEFGRHFHVATEPLEIDPELPLHCGWDPGGTPAFVVSQVNRWGQWMLLSSVSPKEDQSIGVYDFVRMCADHLWTKYAQPYDLELEDLRLVHIGDPAGNQPLPTAGGERREARTFYEVLQSGVRIFLGRDEYDQPRYEERPGWGWYVEPGAMGITERLEAVRSRLTRVLPGGIPALVVNAEPDGRIFVEGFSGGYCYRTRSDGRPELDPFKGYYSHTFDALAYVSTKLDALPPARGDEGDNGREPWRSIASSTARG